MRTLLLLPLCVLTAGVLSACDESNPSTLDDLADADAASEGGADGADQGASSSGAPTGQTPAGQSDGDGNTSPEVCETLEVVARPEPPKVMVVLDRSGSMAGEPWDHAISAVDGLLEAYPDFLFGLAMYPAVGEEQSCKAGKVSVASETGAQPKIHDVLFANDSRAIKDNGYTPTSSTLDVARKALIPPPDDHHERFVLLVTDGQPNCNAEGPEKYSADVPATLAALDALLADNVKTFVVGYRTEQFAGVMTDMAKHGGTTKHYPVEDAASLSAALGEVAVSVAPCTFGLDAQPPGAEFVRVLLDGKELELSSDGFQLSTDGTVSLGVQSCATMRDGKEHAIKVLVECEPVRVI